MASYPEDIPSLTRPVHSDPAADDSPTDATVIVDAISDEIEAIATELGTNPSGESSTVADRISSVETAVSEIPASLVTVTHVGYWTAGTGGTFKNSYALSESRAFGSGDTLTISADDLALILTLTS